MENQFQCNSCDGMTPLVVTTAKTFGEYKRSFATCQLCGYESTIQYTNKKIRSMLTKQENTPVGEQKKKLAKKIDKEVAALRVKFEG